MAESLAAFAMVGIIHWNAFRKQASVEAGRS